MSGHRLISKNFYKKLHASWGEGGGIRLQGSALSAGTQMMLSEVQLEVLVTWVMGCGILLVRLSFSVRVQQKRPRVLQYVQTWFWQSNWLQFVEVFTIVE